MPGDRLLFREGRTKGLGIVKSLGYDPERPLGGVAVGEGKGGEKGEKGSTGAGAGVEDATATKEGQGGV